MAGEMISISTYSHPVGFAVPGYTVAMQESNDRSIFDASATDAIFETPEHDAINAADVFRCKCTCAFCIFDIARSDLGPKLTKQILNDVDAYEGEYAAQCDAPGGAEALAEPDGNVGRVVGRRHADGRSDKDAGSGDGDLHGRDAHIGLGRKLRLQRSGVLVIVDVPGGLQRHHHRVRVGRRWRRRRWRGRW